MPLRPGERLAHYRIVGPLGSGGMGQVFRAVDEKLEREVAIKVLPEAAQDDPQFAARFLREARAASALNHPGVVVVHDLLFDEGRPCIVLELVPGRSFAALVADEGPLPLDRALRLCAGVADALAAAHEHGILHRDIKSANLICTPDDRVKVLDFGLAKRVDSTDTSTAKLQALSRETGRSQVAVADTEQPAGLAAGNDELVTVFGSRLGTPGYVAPELARGQSADARADIFSLGCVLYELCVGKVPFRCHTWGELIDKIERRDWQRPSAARRELPAVLEVLIERALAPERAERYPSMRAFRDAILSLTAERTMIPVRPARGPWLLAGSLLVLAGAAVVALLYRASLPKSSPPAATAPSPPTPRLAGEPRWFGDPAHCALEPTYLPDDTILFVDRDGARFRLVRLEPSSGRLDEILTSKGELRTPAPGPDGSFFFLQGELQTDRDDLYRGFLDGRPPQLVKERTSRAQFALGKLYYVRDDYRALRRLDLKSGLDELLFESKSTMGFGDQSVSPDGSLLAIRRFSVEPRVSAPICLAGTTIGAAVDCTFALDATSNPQFNRDGTAVYLLKGPELLRIDRATRTSRSIHLSPMAFQLARAPSGKQLAASECRRDYVLARMGDDGRVERLDGIRNVTGIVGVGPHGELAMPGVAEGKSVILFSADGKEQRMLAQGGQISEAAISPDGTEVVFHDAGPQGGLFLIAKDGQSAARRLTDNSEDSAPIWADASTLLFERQEDGYPYGRPYRLLINEGKARPLERAFGLPVGHDRQHHRLILWVERGKDGAFWWRDASGKSKPIAMSVPRGWKPERYIATSPNGRYLTTTSGGSLWRIDLHSGAAHRFAHAPLPGDLQMVQADDQGRVYLTWSEYRGRLLVRDGAFP